MEDKLVFIGKNQNSRLKKTHFPAPPWCTSSQYILQKFHGLVLWLVELIDAKGIDVAQPIWFSGCLM